VLCAWLTSGRWEQHTKFSKYKVKMFPNLCQTLSIFPITVEHKFIILSIIACETYSEVGADLITWANTRQTKPVRKRSAVQQIGVMRLTCSRWRRSESIQYDIRCSVFLRRSLYTYRHLPLSTAMYCCHPCHSCTAYNLDQTPVRSSQPYTASSACRPWSDCGSAQIHGIRYHDTGTDQWWRHILDLTNPDGRNHTLSSAHQHGALRNFHI